MSDIDKSEMVRVYPFKVDTGEVNEKTKKPVFRVTYHTEPDGEGDLIKSIISDGTKDMDAQPNSRNQYPSIYYAVKDKDGNRIMDKDVQASFIRSNNKRLGNQDLKKIVKRFNRVMERMAINRKIVAKLTGQELLTESQEQAILDIAKGFGSTADMALLSPIDNSGSETEEEPDLF